MLAHVLNTRASIRLQHLEDGDKLDMDAWFTAGTKSWYKPWEKFILSSSCEELCNIVKLSGVEVDYALEVLEILFSNERLKFPIEDWMFENDPNQLALI